MEEKRFYSRKEAMRQLGLGRNLLERLSLEAGSKTKIGNRYLYDLEKMYVYLETHAVKKEA